MSFLPDFAAAQTGVSNLLGSAVESFTRDAATDAASGRFSSGTAAIANAADSALASAITGALGTDGEELGGRAWQSSKYSEDLIKYAPKSRFIFKVKFVFNAPYTDTNTEFSFVVRNIDRPTVNFEYDEVNMYNFRTKVLRSVVHEPLNMVFHDDIQNKVLEFFDFYRTTYSPVSNLSVDEISRMDMENYGMSFEDPAGDGNYSASSGVLKNNQKNLLRYIELSQVYAHGSRVNKFFFINPKITTFDFDNVDHENSDGNAMTVSFSYDALHIEDDTAPGGTPGPIRGATDVMGNSEVSKAKQMPNAVGDGNIVGKGNPNGIPPIAGGLGGTLGTIALGAASSWLSNQASTTINKLVAGSSFGKNFSNAGGAVSTALGGLAGNLIGEGAAATSGLINSLVASSNAPADPPDTAPADPPADGGDNG